MFNDATAKFYGAADGVGKVTVGNTIGNKFTDIANNVEVANKNSEGYKKDAAAFYGEKFECQSQGSEFMKNSALFHGQDPAGPKIKIKAS